MGHFNASNMTSGPVVAVHAGVNAAIIKYTLNETASGSTTIALTPLPGGARVTAVRVTGNHGALQATAGALVSVYATIGGTTVANYLNSVTYAYGMSQNGTGLGTRLTGSAIVVMRLSECAGTGTASTQFTVVVDYLADQRGD